jgi:GNAT superfamily N-acetyltransferase
MSILAVRPEYQRKGLGSMLLTPVLEQADKENAKAFVQGSVQGVGLYLKHGWEEVDEILIDYSPYGGASDVKTALLVREPR